MQMLLFLYGLILLLCAVKTKANGIYFMKKIMLIPSLAGWMLSYALTCARINLRLIYIQQIEVANDYFFSSGYKLNSTPRVFMFVRAFLTHLQNGSLTFFVLFSIDFSLIFVIWLHRIINSKRFHPNWFFFLWFLKFDICWWYFGGDGMKRMCDFIVVSSYIFYSTRYDMIFLGY